VAIIITRRAERPKSSLHIAKAANFAGSPDDFRFGTEKNNGNTRIRGLEMNYLSFPIVHFERVTN
jgi:hypothetical protein